MNAVPTQPLAALTAGIIAAPADIEIADVTLDSRSVRPGSLFLACRGRTHHGLEFARDALARGARVVLYEPGGEPPSWRSDIQSGPRGEPVFAAGVPDLTAQVGTIADRFFGAPSAALTVAGITGTNGKTTCAWLLAQALAECRRPAAYAGTLGVGKPGALRASALTTADAVSVHRQLAELRALGAECVAMEVSSHALDQARVAGVRFHTAAFTNLTRDHLDYHGSMDAYGAAKARLLSWPGLSARVINVDDPFGAALAARPAAGRLVATTRTPASVRAAADFVRAVHARTAPAGLSIDVDTTWGRTRVELPLVGDFNVDNVLTVLAVLLAWGISLDEAARALPRCTAPPGRMEGFGGNAGRPLVIVDYAHTPDALAKALQAARVHCAGRLTVVFGCGGDRDAGKRPIMGRIAGERADRIVLTDDNPRTEDPAAIVAAIRAGVAASASVSVEHDRAKAIRAAVTSAAAADVVLIAGKGHEDYQIYGETRRPFRDQSVARSALGVGP
ncbi:MAG: UDP-N-acetylmuramoyl-L-alanyl-D-glutamate--2,6-diaminopimelate ligase [Gammaproteobacteria bacterium]